MNLPASPEVEVAKLASVFNETTNSYKFYWLLAILEELAETGAAKLPMRNLSLRMLAGVWYPLDYFKLSFGKQDGFKKLANFVSVRVVIDNRPTAPALFEQLNMKLQPADFEALGRELAVLLRWVPYRFLRPFFAAETKGLPDQKVNGQIQELANSSDDAPYKFGPDYIELSEKWAAYFQQHQYILRGFIFWHLLKFVQKNNPNVIGLSEKLAKPGERNFNIAKKFWKQFLDAQGQIVCIYSGQLVTAATMSLDHFLPWSYVAHDQLWNIIPTPKAVNSAKSDWLPDMAAYFDAYADLQHRAFLFHVAQGNAKLLEDYALLFAQSLADSARQPFLWFRERLEKQVVPHVQTAQNLGFAHPFIFKGPPL